MKRTKYEADTDKLLVGKTIRKAEVTGFGVKFVMSDGTVLDYDSSDGGYSAWDVYKIKLVGTDHIRKGNKNE